MQRFYCDACNKELRAGTDRRYVVRMEARRADEADAKLTDADLDGQDDPDHIDAMDELLAAADDDTELEPTPTAAPEPVEYDLCDRCFARFHADPLGLDRARPARFARDRPMSPTVARLLALLKERSFKTGDFVLASGNRSTYFIDGKLTQVSSEGAYLIGEAIYEATRDLAFDAVGGLAAGAIPLATAAVISYHHHGRTLEGFWVRSEVKDHGTKKRVEGNLTPGSRVVIVDDVITRGGSSLKAIDEVRALGCEVVCVVTLVDRLQGGAKLFRDKGIADYRPILTIRDFGVQVDDPSEGR